MDEQTKKELKITAIVCITTAVVVIAAFVYDFQKDIRMAELGFQKTTIQGSSATYFQKVPNGKVVEQKVYDRLDILPNEVR